MIHELKILPEYFNAVISGEKTFEIRKNDRPFHKGDLLALNEFDGQYWTGNSCLVYVDYILNNPDYVKKDMIIMGIKPCSVFRHTEPFNHAKIAKDYSVPLATKCDDERRCGVMAELNDKEFKDFNEIVQNTLNSLIDCADKHNIDRDSFIKYFGAIFGTMAKVSTFTNYTRTPQKEG